MSLAGHLLIAPAHLRDPNFAQSVILLVRHDEEGAFGLVLNRPTEESIQSIWEKVHGAPCAATQLIQAGGPVPGPLVALHREPAVGELQVLPGVWCSMQGEAIAELVEGTREHVRYFAGYSGWGAGQLEGELSVGSWLTTEADAGDVFEIAHAALWQRAFVRATELPDLRGPDPGPADPRLN